MNGRRTDKLTGRIPTQHLYNTPHIIQLQEERRTQINNHPTRYNGKRACRGTSFGATNEDMNNRQHPQMDLYLESIPKEKVTRPISHIREQLRTIQTNNDRNNR